MRPTCFINGSCDVCGCETTMLQMANKACEGGCYPHMMKAGYWKDINESPARRQMLNDFYPEQNAHVK